MQANCPICLEDIGSGNCVITECGHSFHTNCLMQNVAHNGFGCPYCRSEMAAVPQSQDEIDSESEYEPEFEEDYVLRGLRFFTNNLNLEEHELPDVVEELDLHGQQIKPPVEYIAEKIIEAGITIQDFVKAMLKDIREYDDEEEEYNRLDDELFEKIRGVIINYQSVNVPP